jgi:mannose-6-phosphate isomerase-like protein (cupin superfamily)
MEYKIGESDIRPWGSYTVTNVYQKNNKEICEKNIIINPGHILSLQSHSKRSETWHVLQGVLTTIADGQHDVLSVGAKIHIPIHAIHCMANMGTDTVVVKEIQKGICRESDIIRYIDSYGRTATFSDNSNPNINNSILIYKALVNQINSNKNI